MNFESLRRTIANYIDPDNKIINKYNEALFWATGGGYVNYDPNNPLYLEKGYNINPFVYSMVNAMSTKTASIPFYIKQVEEESSLKKLNRLKDATKWDMTIQQKLTAILLENKALSEDEMEMPLEVPNSNQTWTEFIALYKTYMKTIGNAYIYMLAPDEGKDSGVPQSIYLLPSQYVQIVMRDTTEIRNLAPIENPIDHFILTEGNQYIEFRQEEIIHIKYPNPNASSAEGEHLYGMSPLRAALKNIENSNVALDLNIKTLKSGGAFGFLHGKQTPITVDQAKEMKERLLEMNASPEDMSKIAGVSAEIGFTRISLTSDELKPFDYLNFDKEQIADVLIWSLEDANRGDYGGTINEIKKTRLTDNIMPDLKLLERAFNKELLPRFKGYENTVIVWDVNSLPEMQEDIGALSTWLSQALDRGVVTRNEYRIAINFIPSEDTDLDIHTVASDVLTLEEAVDDTFTTESPREEMKVLDVESQEQWNKMLRDAKIAANEN